MNTDLQRTPLYKIQKEAGARFVPFVGWEMPVQFSGVIEEHEAVRKHAGIFDVSHMGELFVEGDDAESFLQKLCCNDVSKLVDGKAQYSAFLNDNGGVIDDIIIYRFNEKRFLICVNASNAEKDFAWLQQNQMDDIALSNESAAYAQIALQGPEALRILSQVLGEDLEPKLGVFHFLIRTLEEQELIIARTGYTGEDGVELFIPTAAGPELAISLWSNFLEAGAKPCGLGARDSLRLEASYPLHGHELQEDIPALESGLGWIIKFEKGDFIGREALLKLKEQGLKRKLIGFELEGAGIAREETKVFHAEGQEIGLVTSGTKTPTLGKAVGMTFIDTEYAEAGLEVVFEVRGRKIQGKLKKLPLYKRGK